MSRKFANKDDMSACCKLLTPWQSGVFSVCSLVLVWGRNGIAKKTLIWFPGQEKLSAWKNEYFFLVYQGSIRSLISSDIITSSRLGKDRFIVELQVHGLLLHDLMSKSILFPPQQRNYPLGIHVGQEDCWDSECQARVSHFFWQWRQSVRNGTLKKYHSKNPQLNTKDVKPF